MSKAVSNSAAKLVLADGKGPLVVEGNNIDVEFTGGKVVVRSGLVELGAHAQLASTASPASVKTGAVVRGGAYDGWTYCETKKGRPFLIAPKDSGVMQWREAMEYAARGMMDLPTKAELDAMFEERNMGALKDTFNLTRSYPACWYWSATQHDANYTWRQHFRNGDQDVDSKSRSSSVRCVRRLMP